MSNTHIVTAFENELRDINRKVAEMGGLAEKSVIDSVDALIKRTERRQIPSYRVSVRLLRYRLAEIDLVIARNRLTARRGEPTMDIGACLPTGKEDVE